MFKNLNLFAIAFLALNIMNCKGMGQHNLSSEFDQEAENVLSDKKKKFMKHIETEMYNKAEKIDPSTANAEQKKIYMSIAYYYKNKEIVENMLQQLGSEYANINVLSVKHNFLTQELEKTWKELNPNGKIQFPKSKMKRYANDIYNFNPSSSNYKNTVDIEQHTTPKILLKQIHTQLSNDLKNYAKTMKSGELQDKEKILLKYIFLQENAQAWNKFHTARDEMSITEAVDSYLKTNSYTTKN